MVLNYSDSSIQVFFPHAIFIYVLQFTIFNCLRMNWTAVSVFACFRTVDQYWYYLVLAYKVKTQL